MVGNKLINKRVFTFYSIEAIVYISYYNFIYFVPGLSTTFISKPCLLTVVTLAFVKH